MPNDGVKWPIPTVPWGQTRHKIAFDDASEEVKAKFRELYPVSFNKEMGRWFGISECMVKYIGQRLGLRKNRTVIQRRNNEPYKYRVRAVLDKIKARGECQSYVNLYKDDLFRLYNAFPGILREYLMQKGYM